MRSITNSYVRKYTCRPSNVAKDGWYDGCKDEYGIYTYEWMDGWMNGWPDGHIEEQTDERTYGRTDRRAQTCTNIYIPAFPLIKVTSIYLKIL